MFVTQRAFNSKELHYPLEQVKDDLVAETHFSSIAPEPLTEVARRHAGFVIEDFYALGQKKLIVTSWEAKAIYLFNKIDSTKIILRNKLSAAGLRILSATMDEVIITTIR